MLLVLTNNLWRNTITTLMCSLIISPQLQFYLQFHHPGYPDYDSDWSKGLGILPDLFVMTQF
jgi:hypothetical protein